jgi:hypothetical protein
MIQGSKFRIIDVVGLGDEAVIVCRQPVGLLLIDSMMSLEDRADIMEQALAEALTWLPEGAAEGPCPSPGSSSPVVHPGPHPQVDS